MTSTALTSPAAIARGRATRRGHPGQVGNRVMLGHHSSPRICGTRNRPSSAAGAPASACSWVRPGPDSSVAEDVGQRHGMTGRLDVVGGGHLGHLRHRRQDHLELAEVGVQLGIGEIEPGQVGQVRDVLAGEQAGVRRSARCCWTRSSQVVAAAHPGGFRSQARTPVTVTEWRSAGSSVCLDRSWIALASRVPTAALGSGARWTPHDASR